MWDKVAMLVALATCLTVAETSEDTRSLQELLAALRNFIENRRTSNVPDNGTAYDDIRTAYAHSVTAGDVQKAESAGRGNWTSWLNVDKPSMIGEFENCARVHYVQDMQAKCLLPCKVPLAAQYAMANSNTTATWTDIHNCIGPMDISNCGVACLNLDAREHDKTNCDLSNCQSFGLGPHCDHCPNIRVRFFCMGKQPDVNKCCPDAMDCPITGNSLARRLERLDNEAQRNDVVGEILEEIRDYLGN